MGKQVFPTPVGLISVLQISDNTSVAISKLEAQI